MALKKPVCVKRTDVSRVLLCVLISMSFCACATTSPPDPKGPSKNEPPYPVLMTETEDRREAALTAWTKFTGEQGITNAAAPDLQPVTATIRALPTLSGTPLSLPKVGDTVPMNEENLRESLRRFIASASPLIGAQPQQLSLIQRVDAADGTMRALYEQRPFRYPLRGGYGKLEIAFTPDRRVLQINSTCIPEIESLQRAGAGIKPKWEADKIREQITGLSFDYRDAAGNPQTLSIDKNDEVIVRDLVVYPRPRSGEPAILEFHLAWEITLKRSANPLTIYLDAVTNEIIEAAPFSG